MLCRLKGSLANPCIFLHLSHARFYKILFFYHTGWKTSHRCFCEQQSGFFPWVYVLSWMLNNVNQCCDKHAWRIWQDKCQFSNIHGNVKEPNNNKNHLLPSDGYPFLSFFPLILYQRTDVGFKQSLFCSLLLGAGFPNLLGLVFFNRFSILYLKLI